jgi:hypothetical protein
MSRYAFDVLMEVDLSLVESCPNATPLRKIRQVTVCHSFETELAARCDTRESFESLLLLNCTLLAVPQSASALSLKDLLTGLHEHLCGQRQPFLPSGWWPDRTRPVTC